MTHPAPGGGRQRNDFFLAPLPVADEPPEPAPEEPPPPAASEPVGRRPRRGAAAALVAVALLVGLAVVGDGGEGGEGGGERAGSPIATTTTAPRPATTVAPSTTAAGERGPTGQLLPEPTGAALVVVTQSQILVADLDTGAVRSVAAAGRDNYHGAWAVGGAAVVQTSGGATAVPAVPGEDPVVLTGDRAADWPLASDRPGHVWLIAHVGDGVEGREVSVEGHETGRRFLLPAPHGGMVAVDGGLVIETLGSLTFYDPDTGEARAIGHGAPLAGSGDTLARLSCEALRCGLHLTDVRTGGDVEVPPAAEIDFAPFSPAAFSPDGRWLAVPVGPIDAGPDRVAVIDGANGEVVAVHPSVMGYGSPFTFSPDSRWLFLLDGRDVVAHRLGTEEALTLEGLHPGGAIALAAVAIGE